MKKNISVKLLCTCIILNITGLNFLVSDSFNLNGINSKWNDSEIWGEGKTPPGIDDIVIVDKGAQIEINEGKVNIQKISIGSTGKTESSLTINGEAEFKSQTHIIVGEKTGVGSLILKSGRIITEKGGAIFVGNAKGDNSKLIIEGGEVDVGGITIGSNCIGFMEIHGSNSLVIKPGFFNLFKQSNLNLFLDQSGITPIKTKTLNINDGAKITIDLSKYEGESQTISFITFKSIITLSSEAKIYEIINTDKYSASVKSTPTSLDLVIEKK